MRKTFVIPMTSNEAIRLETVLEQEMERLDAQIVHETELEDRGESEFKNRHEMLKTYLSLRKVVDSLQQQKEAN